MLDQLLNGMLQSQLIRLLSVLILGSTFHHTLQYVQLTNIFSHSLGFLFTLLIIPTVCKKHQFDEILDVYFALISCTYGFVKKIILAYPKAIIKDSAHIFKCLAHSEGILCMITCNFVLSLFCMGIFHILRLISQKKKIFVRQQLAVDGQLLFQCFILFCLLKRHQYCHVNCWNIHNSQNMETTVLPMT